MHTHELIRSSNFAFKSRQLNKYRLNLVNVLNSDLLLLFAHYIYIGRYSTHNRNELHSKFEHLCIIPIT